MTEKNRLVIITAPSAAGKTTLQAELLKRGWKRPINFTTRKPRGDEELDEYVFLTKKQYFEKLSNGDFLESTNYGGNWYGVSKTLPDGKVCVVLDPIGKTQVVEKVVRERLDVSLTCFFLEISQEEQEKRLRRRGDGEEDIAKRKLDFQIFLTQQNDIILNGGWSVNILADLVENE